MKKSDIIVIGWIHTMEQINRMQINKVKKNQNKWHNINRMKTKDNLLDILWLQSGYTYHKNMWTCKEKNKKNVAGHTRTRREGSSWYHKNIISIKLIIYLRNKD